MKYPIYIPTKGRFENNLTAELLLKSNIDFRLFVEDTEYQQYEKRFGSDKLVALDGHDFGGVGYARNFIKDYSISRNEKRHWQLDDDIKLFYRLNKGINTECSADEALSAVEDFTDQFQNIGITGLSANTFVKFSNKPYEVNRFAYTCFLVNNSISCRFRKELEEDLDMNLQILTSGLCTVKINLYNFAWASTGARKGGCTTEYKGSKLARLRNAKILALTWPQYVTVVWKFNRWHFQVKDNWRCFHNKLIRRTDIDWSQIPETNEYGIQLIKRQEIRSKELQQFYDENTGNKKNKIKTT